MFLEIRFLSFNYGKYSCTFFLLHTLVSDMILEAQIISNYIDVTDSVLKPNYISSILIIYVEQKRILIKNKTRFRQKCTWHKWIIICKRYWKGLVCCLCIVCLFTDLIDTNFK